MREKAGERAAEKIYAWIEERKGEKTEHVDIFIINIVSTIAFCSGNMSNVRPVKATELKWIDKQNLEV